jgi:hypothetical protein
MNMASLVDGGHSEAVRGALFIPPYPPLGNGGRMNINSRDG